MDDVLSGSTLVTSRIPLLARVIGLLFAAVNAMVGSGAIPLDLHSAGFPFDSGWAMMGIAGIGFVLAGLRHFTVIDFARKTIVTCRGWLFIVVRRERALGQWTQVLVGPAEEKGTGSDRYTAIPISVVGRQGTAEVQEVRTRAGARSLAARISAITGLSIKDVTAGD